MRTVAAVVGALALAGTLSRDGEIAARSGAESPDAGLSQGALPQGRARRAAAADAGAARTKKEGPVYLGTDPPGRLRPSPADAGAAAQRDAGPSAEELELRALRARVDALEQERGQRQQEAQQLNEVVRQLQELRGQMADAEQRRQVAEEEQVARREQLQSGLTALYQAQYLLAGGNASVDDQLAQAQAAFPPQAQRDIEAARMALRNRDLSAARAYLGNAIAAAQQGR